MRVMISADMEGASGVTWPDDVVPGTEQWQRFRRMLTSDVNAAIAGFYAGGASDVQVTEAHSTMRNILLEDLDPRAVMLTGRHKPLGMMDGVAEADAVAFVGYHAGAGEPGVLAHTYLGAGLIGLWINGEPASEGRLNALLAGSYGVPVVLVTGDEQCCADAAGYAPAAEAVAVKTSVSRYAAICRHPSVTATEIEAAAHRAARLAGRAEPVTGRWRFEVEFHATQLADAATQIPDVELVTPRRVGFELDDIVVAARCFRACTQLAGAAVERDYG
ncbi:MAG TPA: M55 family metallopeptidase [Actinomycetes bacterium]|nr:M55 family metallopeptidase [Actinomycetes bacterium]